MHTGKPQRFLLLSSAAWKGQTPGRAQPCRERAGTLGYTCPPHWRGLEVLGGTLSRPVCAALPCTHLSRRAQAPLLRRGYIYIYIKSIWILAEEHGPQIMHAEVSVALKSMWSHHPNQAPGSSSGHHSLGTRTESQAWVA